MSSDAEKEFIDESKALAAELIPFLKDADPAVAGCVLGELLGLYLAGYRPDLRPEIRERIDKMVDGIIKTMDNHRRGRADKPH